MECHIILNDLLDSIKNKYYFLSTFILVLILISTLIISNFFFKSYLDNELNEKINSLQKFVEANGLGYILSEKALLQIKSHAKKI